MLAQSAQRRALRCPSWSAGPCPRLAFAHLLRANSPAPQLPHKRKLHRILPTHGSPNVLLCSRSITGTTAAQNGPVIQICSQCGALLLEPAEKCTFCDSPLVAQDEAPEPVPVGVSAPADPAANTGYAPLTVEPEWRREVSRRLEAYRVASPLSVSAKTNNLLRILAFAHPPNELTNPPSPQLPHKRKLHRILPTHGSPNVLLCSRSITGTTAAQKRTSDTNLLAVRRAFARARRKMHFL